MWNIVLRNEKGIELTYDEGDNNFKFLDRKRYITDRSPTVDDDESNSFFKMAQFVDNTTFKKYECLDSSIGAAVWIEVKSFTVDDFNKIQENATNIAQNSAKIEINRQGISENSDAISSLASSNGSFKSESSQDILTTATQLLFNIDTQSTDLEVFEIDEANDTITFKKSANYVFQSTLNIASSTSGERVITFNLVDTSDDSVIATEQATLQIGNGQNAVIPVSTLVVIAEGNEPTTIRVEVIGSDVGYTLAAFTSILSTNAGGAVVATSTGLEALDEGSGIGWRLIGRDDTKYAHIGFNSIDFVSTNDVAGDDFGVSGQYSIASGLNNKVSGGHCFVNGESNTVSAGGNVVTGGSNVVSGTNNLVSGYSNSATGNNSIAKGSGIENSASGSISIGGELICSHDFSCIVGMGLKSSKEYSCWSGQYNINTSTIEFGIGNGADNDNRSNLLEVRTNGAIYIDKMVGDTASRPSMDKASSFPYFDTELGYPIWHNGTEWVDSAGAAVGDGGVS